MRDDSLWDAVMESKFWVFGILDSIFKGKSWVWSIFMKRKIEASIGKLFKSDKTEENTQNSLPWKYSLYIKALNLSPSLLHLIYNFFDRTICTLCNYLITLHKPKKILSSWLINESILPATSLVLQLSFLLNNIYFYCFP